MKSLLFVHNGVKIGGGERSLLALFKGLDRTKYKICVVCSDFTPFSNEVRKLGVSIIHGQFSSLRNIYRLVSNINRLKSIIRTHHIDLIHGNTPQTNLPAALAAKSLGIPSVWHERVLVEDKMIDIDRLFSWMPSKIICNSEAIRRRFNGVKCYDKTISIINGVDIEAFSPDYCSVMKERESLNIPRNSFIIGCFDRLDPVKNHELIIDAFKMSLREFPHSFLIIAGQAIDHKSNRQQILKEKIRKLGLFNFVRFLGFQDDVRSAMMACDVIVQASRSEGCSRSLCEAQAMGKPVVASNIGGNPEVVVHGQTGFLFDVNSLEDFVEKLSFLSKNKEVKEKIGVQARQMAIERLSLSSYCQKIEAVYQQLLPKEQLS